MEITDVRIYPVKAEGKFKAFASITLEDKLVIRGLRVVEGRNGFFVAMPSRKFKDDYYDVCFPITSKFKDEISKKVMGKYEDLLKDAV